MTDKAATALRKEWHDNPRWKGIKRPYKAEDVLRLRGNVQIDYKGAENENAGTWGAYAAYRHIGQNVSFAPTYDTFLNIWNKKGWEVGTEYVPFKNVHAYLYYFDGEKLDGNNVDTHSLFGRVSFFF